jgi:molecular chaperone GrpE (heat shock protein)
MPRGHAVRRKVPRERTTPAARHHGDDGTLQHEIETLGREVAQLRRTLLKLGHAQEMFQERIEEEVGRLVRREEPDSIGSIGDTALPSSAQQRALMEVDQAVLHLLDLTRKADRQPMVSDAGDPRSVREGLALLQVRVRNLQRSFGLEPVPAAGCLFDDRLHQAHGVCHRPDLADGEVAEEILPGYRLRDRVIRPALVIVNRRNE